MLVRIEIAEITGTTAYGALVFEDGSMYPVRFPINTYEDLCTRGFFELPSDLPPAEGEVLNFSSITESITTVEANYMEGLSGQRVF